MKRPVFIAFGLSTFFFLGLETLAAQTAAGAKTMKSENPKSKPAQTETQPTARSVASESSAKPNAPTFKEVTKEKFKEIYFRLGGGKRSGWTAEYWQESFEKKSQPGWRFIVEEPRSSKHTRMNIVSDQKPKEHRMYFSTEADEDTFDWPGDE